MRSVKIITLLGFVLLACMSLLFVGCGSDDAPTSNAGSLSNPEFIAVQDQVESLVDSTFGFILTGMNSIVSISSGGNIDPVLYGPSFGDTNQVTPSYVNGWHIVNATAGTADFSFNFVDSVRFYSNNAISQFGIDADSLWYRHHWNYDVADKAVSYTTFDGDASFDYRGLNTNQASITGSNDLSIDNQFVSVDSTVIRTFEFATDVTNLSINAGPSGWDHACPNSGTVSTTVTMTYARDDAAVVTTTWNVSMTFTDGTAAVSVSSGNVVWNYTSDVCIALN